MKDSYGSPRVSIRCFCEGDFEINDTSVENRGKSEVEPRRGADDRLGEDIRASHRVICYPKSQR